MVSASFQYFRVTLRMVTLTAQKYLAVYVPLVITVPLVRSGLLTTSVQTEPTTLITGVNQAVFVSNAMVARFAMEKALRSLQAFVLQVFTVLVVQARLHRWME